jgi:hypothetical protein
VTSPPQGYPQHYPAPPRPAPRGPVGPRWTAGLLAALALLIAAAGAVWGSFEKIQSYRHTYPTGTPEYRYEATWWRFDESGPSASLPRDWFPPYGVLLAIGAGLLVIAAILALTAFSRRRPGLVTGARVSAALGVGLLAGAVAIRLLDALQTLDQVNAEKLEPGESTDFSIGLGIYLPAGAVALGIVALLLTLSRGRAGRVEPDTPRMGFAMPYQPQQYQPYQQQPVSQPVPAQQQPASQPFPAQQAPAQQPASQPVEAQQPPSQPFQQPVPEPVPEQPPAQSPVRQPEPPAQQPDAPRVSDEHR